MFIKPLSIFMLLVSVAVEVTALCTGGLSFELQRRSAEKKFVHLGYTLRLKPFHLQIFKFNSYYRILHTKGDLDRMEPGVQKKLDPWYLAFFNFSQDIRSSATYKMKGPKTFVVRDSTGSQSGRAEFSHDGVAALRMH